MISPLEVLPGLILGQFFLVRCGRPPLHAGPNRGKAERKTVARADSKAEQLGR
jgi:hypothetical protein